MKAGQELAVSQSKEFDHAEIDGLIALSNDLILKAQWPRLNINEQRLVLYMLALIKKHDQDFKHYRITVRELVNVLGITNKDIYREIDKATDTLMTKVIKWLDPEYDDLVKVTWCYYARLAEGRGYVELSFAPELKPFLLALKGRFTSYELRAVIRLKNHYSLRIYQFLKYNQGMATRDGRKSVTVSLDWLKEYLGADTSGYRTFGPFRQKVLNPAQQDIREKTDLMFDYDLVKDGRRVKALIFSWKPNPDYDQQELPFEPPIEHQQDERPNARRRTKKSLPLQDEISLALQNLGFDDWQAVRDRLSADDWRLALADLEYNVKHKSKGNGSITNPGGWLRRRLPDPGVAYTPSNPYQKHLDEVQAKERRSRRKAQAARERETAAAEQHAAEHRLQERIDAKLKSLSKKEKTALRAAAEEKAREILPEPPRDAGQVLAAARARLDTLSKTQQTKLRRQAIAGIKQHLQETGRTLNLDSPAGQTVLNNRILEIVTMDHPIETTADLRYREELESVTEQALRNLVQEQYQLTGDPA